MDEIKDNLKQLRKTQAPVAFRSLQQAITEHVEDINSACTQDSPFDNRKPHLRYTSWKKSMRFFVLASREKTTFTTPS